MQMINSSIHKTIHCNETETHLKACALSLLNVATTQIQTRLGPSRQKAYSQGYQVISKQYAKG